MYNVESPRNWGAGIEPFPGNEVASLRKSSTINRLALTAPMLALLLVPVLSQAQVPDSSYSEDSYLDPLAFTRIDAQAVYQPGTLND